jgi:putative acetyltransferase
MHPSTPLITRPERPDDHPGIRRLNEAAFGSSAEADLVEQLRVEGVVLLSVVVEMQEEIVGHALMSRMWIQTAAGTIDAAALAPVAVSPAVQRQGIGSQVIRYALDAMQRAGERIVIVLGHPEYYPRFGFSTEHARLLESPFPVEAYMALELAPGALQGVRGKVEYARAFGL